jgi:hypothetical protein
MSIEQRRSWCNCVRVFFGHFDFRLLGIYARVVAFSAYGTARRNFLVEPAAQPPRILYTETVLGLRWVGEVGQLVPYHMSHCAVERYSLIRWRTAPQDPYSGEQVSTQHLDPCCRAS